MRRILLALSLLLCAAPSWAVTATQYDGIAKTAAGVAINAATCTVFVSATSATKATIFSDTGGSSQSNPFTTASNGTYTIFLVSGRYRIDCSNGTTVFSSFVTMPIQTTGGGPALPVSVPNGGTAATSLTSHGVVIGQGTSAVHVTSAGTSGQVLTSNGASSDPTFQAAAGGGIGGSLGSTADNGVCVSGTGGTTAKACDSGGADFVGGISFGHALGGSGAYPWLKECNTNELCIGGRRAYGYEFYAGDSSTNGSGATWLFGDGRIHGLSGGDSNFTAGGTGTNGHWIFGGEGANTIQIVPAATAPYACSNGATVVGSIWMDSSAGDTAVLMCFCNGTNWVSSTTGLTCS